MKIGIIVGSNRPKRISYSIAQWVKDQLSDERLELSLIDLAAINLPFLNEPEIPSHHHYSLPQTESWSKLIDAYDGFVIVFPQYNWGYPAVLKNAMDFLYDEWHGKPVSLVSHGTHGGFQAALAMSLVVQGLKMTSLPTNPKLIIHEDMFDSEGKFIDIDKSFAAYRGSLKALADEFAIFKNI